MAMGYSGVILQSRIQQSALISEQRQTRMEDNQDKRVINTQIKDLQSRIATFTNQKLEVENDVSLRKNILKNSKTERKFIQNVFCWLAPNSSYAKNQAQLYLDSEISKLENDIKQEQDNLTERSSNRQTRLDEIDLEITACQEQIKDAKKQGEESTKEMFGANG